MVAYVRIVDGVYQERIPDLPSGLKLTDLYHPAFIDGLTKITAAQDRKYGPGDLFDGKAWTKQVEPVPEPAVDDEEAPLPVGNE